MDFVAIDFETANSRADSACQLAAVSVREGQIDAELKWYIRPPRNYFSRRNIAIHGIRPADVANADTMDQIWQQLWQMVDGRVLVAHNAGFDIGVLVASLEARGVACPFLEFSCTRAIARAAWPGRARYGLKPLGNWLGIQFQHHDALEDARCCAKIALAAATRFEIQSVPALERRLRLTRGKYNLGRISTPKTIRSASLSQPSLLLHSSAEVEVTTSAASPTNRQLEFVFSRNRSARPGLIDPNVVLDAAAGSQPLSRKHIVFLGTLRGMTAEKTQKLVELLGGICDLQITSETDYVVACGGTLIQDATQVLAAHTKANNEQTKSRAVRLLSERQFLALLPGGKAAVRW